VGRDEGQAGPRDPRHVRAMSADLDKAQAEGGGVVNRRHRQQSVAVSHWARFGHDARFVGLNTTSELRKYWWAILGFEPSRPIVN